MTREHHWVDTEDEQAGANRQTASLAGLAVALMLVVGGLFVVKALHHSGQMEDCMLSGRSNCDVILADLH